MKVGDQVVHVEQFTWGGKPREIRRAKVVRETATQWVDDLGDRYRKSDGQRIPMGSVTIRRIMSIEDFEEAQSA